ncbi:MAG: hypothetical protein ACRDPD_00815 [Streptosporangiaceae bacterium]
MSGKSFRKLSGKVAREYRRKGISAATARRWGNATAGKVRARKRAKRR